MKEKNKKVSFGLIMVVYLLGIFMGAIDTGIVTPARTVIQNNLLVNDKTGIWMITIYTLAYAASIPIMGKLADKFGRKYVYLISIFLFGTGSLFCGLAQDFGSFQVLLIARVVQAIGGGGILPVATAEFGTTFPSEKRGMALGLVGGVYGIANIFGASAGSAILDIFGKNNWQFIFYINLPITVFILIAGFLTLPNTKVINVKKIDGLGISILTVMILTLLYGLKNIDFFDFTNTIVSSSVYPFLIIFLVLLPIFIFIEKKAEDPVLNLSFFTSLQIIIILILSFVTGIILMGMIFVPQFSENALKISSGSGGYFVIILGLAAGVGAPFSGKLIDKFGPKPVLGFGFLVSIIGSLFLIFVTTNYSNNFNVVVCLILFGLGIGFTMGTPLNYMMLENTKEEEANSALSTVSLIRSIGTTIAPAIMIGFIAHAGVSVQSNVMSLLPSEIEVPSLPYSKEISDEITKLKSDQSMKDKLKDVNFPDLNSLTKINISMNETSSEASVSTELLERMKSSDATTITENSKVFAENMFNQMTPSVIINIQSGIQRGIDGMNLGLQDLQKSIANLQNVYDRMGAGSSGSIKSSEQLLGSINGMKLAASEIEDTISKMTEMKNAVPSVFETGKNNYLSKIDQSKDILENEFQKTLNEGFKQLYLTVAISSFCALILLAFYKKSED